MEVEEWHLLEAASVQADKGLETIERYLDNFEEAVSIAHTAMTWDLLPYSKVSILLDCFFFLMVFC